MKLLWAQDFDFMVHPGGAQLTDRAHFIEGIKRGHNLRMWTPQSETNDSDLDDKGVNVVASNPVFLGTEVFQLMVDKRIPYVWFFHDYMPLCKYRLFYPMRESCRSCFLKERWLPYFTKAKLLIWLSPLHRESWLWVCPELEGLPYHLTPSPVNPDLFYDMGLPRKGAVSVESLHPFKGRDRVIKWASAHPEVQIDIVGGNPYPGIPLPPNCKDVGPVLGSKMNEFYNHHEIFLHLPSSPSPFDRTVPEAYLAGCKVVGNELIGALSYPWFTSREQVADECRASPRRLWERLEEVLGDGKS